METIAQEKRESQEELVKSAQKDVEDYYGGRIDPYVTPRPPTLLPYQARGVR